MRTESAPLPERAQVVIIGGGVIGASVAYHLARLGRSDVLLLEQSELSSGTTWHAAGLIVSGGMTTETLAWMARYTRDLLASLEQETGVPTGFRPVGYIQTASTPERAHKLAREADFLRLMGIERHRLTAREVARHWPQLDVSDVIAGYYTAEEGRAIPTDVVLSLAAGARRGGVTIAEGVRVTAIEQRLGRVTGVVTDHGTIEAEVVVNCAGMWARQVGDMAGVAVPLQACEHGYLISEPIPGVSSDLPILEDPDRYSYYREEDGGLMVGLFEPLGAAWSVERIPDGFSFGEIPTDHERMTPFFETAMEILPVMQGVGIRKIFTGPESFTPDNSFLIGETPELRNFFVAAGMNSLGILTSGGAGAILAEWIVDGTPPVDVTDIDIARMAPFQANRAYLAERAPELAGRLHSTGSWPHSHPTTARGLRRSPIHDRLAGAGAHFVESSGWENVGWFDRDGVSGDLALTYARQPWFELHAAEHRAVREAATLFDLSAMSKILVQGPDAEAVLDRMSANDIAVAPGRCVYTQWLDTEGRILADLTVTRLAGDRFLVVVAEAFHRRTMTMLERAIGVADRAAATDVTSAYALLSVQGPRSRDLLSQLTPAKLTNDDFAYLTSQVIELGSARVIASRLSFVGELGWELYVPSEFAVAVYDEIVAAGEPSGLVHCGMETLESTRTEAGRRDYGLDMENTDDPLEAGLAFAVAFDKSRDFRGREALRRRREAGPPKRRLVQFLLDDPEPLLYGEEPILRDGQPVGYLRSAAYGHTLGGAMGMGYVQADEGVTRELLEASTFEVVVAGERVPARVSLRPMYDPNGERVRL